MGIKTQTVMTCTCDMCHAECGQWDGEIKIQVDGGDGRDVGPGYIKGSLKVTLPYRVSDGIICHDCKIKWLAAYVAQFNQAPTTTEAFADE